MKRLKLPGFNSYAFAESNKILLDLKNLFDRISISIFEYKVLR